MYGYDGFYDGFDGFYDGMYDPFYGNPYYGHGHGYERYPYRRRSCGGFGCRRRRW